MCIFACLNEVKYPIYREVSHELQVPQWMQKVVHVVCCQICRCCDKDPNSDLPEIKWPDVGRTLDLFFFIAFIAGQGALTFFFKTVLSSGYILILLSIENILASLIETCQGWSRMRNVK